MVKVKSAAKWSPRAVRWEDVFDQVFRDSAHGDLDGAIVVGLCSDGFPELFVTGTCHPDEVIAALRKLERFILERCDVDRSGTLRWIATRAIGPTGSMAH